MQGGGEVHGSGIAGHDDTRQHARKGRDGARRTGIVRLHRARHRRARFARLHPGHREQAAER